MDILDKHAATWERHRLVIAAGQDPFSVCFDAVLSPTHARVGDKSIMLFGTNNYLGLTFDPACVDAASAALKSHGTGTTGSRIANGTFALHGALERQIAAFMKRRSAIVFSTGYQANLAMIAGLAGPKDIVLIDADSHASIYDACHLSRAQVIRFRHNDPADLDRRLTRLGSHPGCRLIVVEGLYSMLGDRAPLGAFAEVKRRHAAFLLVDEAHSLCVLGKYGRGAAEEQHVENEVDFVVGTFSKSLGAGGGFGASNHPRFDILRLVSRAYMYTAAGSPAEVASVSAALERIQSDPDLRGRLWRNVKHFYRGLQDLDLEIASEPSPIVALRFKDESEAIEMWNRLFAHGVYVNLALPPGTPDGASLLRASITAGHTEEDIAGALDCFASILAEPSAAEASRALVAPEGGVLVTTRSSADRAASIQPPQQRG